MSDIEWAKFKELGGAEWLRQYVNSRAKLPDKYYEVFNKPKEAATQRAADLWRVILLLRQMR
jgi:hypothetical protein